MNKEDNLQKVTIDALKNLIPTVDDGKKDRDTIEYFKKEILSGNHTPILIDEISGDIIDGNHRMVAYEELGQESPLLYWGTREDFYNAVVECNYDGIEAINKMIADGTATKVSD